MTIDPTPDETTAERIARNFPDPGRAAQAAVQQVVGNFASELRRSYSGEPGSPDADDPIELIRKIAAEHGYPIYI
jgi:hypothetical protein